MSSNETRNTTVAVDPEDILSDWHREILTPNAVKLFTGIWHRMRIRGSAAVWLSDEEASRRSRLLIQFVASARTELINAQLLKCKQGSKEWLYEYVEQNGSEFDDDSALEIGAGA